MVSEGKVVSVKYHAPNRGLTRNHRPSADDKEYYRKRRYHENVRFIEYFGKEAFELFKAKGFLTVKNRNKPIMPKTVSVVTDEGDTVVTELVAPHNTRITQSALDVMETIVASLSKGKVVEGFALIPEGKVATNPTVDKVVIEKFKAGHPSYGYSLVALKESK